MLRGCHLKSSLSLGLLNYHIDQWLIINAFVQGTATLYSRKRKAQNISLWTLAYGNRWVTAWTTDWAPGEKTWSALGAQVKAIQLYDQKGWSMAAPLRPHFRADCNWGRFSFWRSLLGGAFPCEPIIFWYRWAIFSSSIARTFLLCQSFHRHPFVVTSFPLYWSVQLLLMASHGVWCR